MTTTTAPLEQALDYDNTELIDAFLKRYDISREEAHDIFHETKKWLWLCANASPQVPIFINDPMFMIDEMWHLFITYTHDYTSYCNSKFGQYIHHVPTSSAERDKAAKEFRADPEKYREARKERFRSFYREICRLLGVRTLYKWQIMYRQQYSPEIRARLASKPFGDKSVTPMTPLGEREKATFHDMLYVREREEDELIEELTAIELSGTSLWPNHACGHYCTCRTPCNT